MARNTRQFRVQCSDEFRFQGGKISANYCNNNYLLVCNVKIDFRLLLLVFAVELLLFLMLLLVLLLLLLHT